MLQVVFPMSLRTTSNEPITLISTHKKYTVHPSRPFCMGHHPPCKWSTVRRRKSQTLYCMHLIQLKPEKGNPTENSGTTKNIEIFVFFRVCWFVSRISCGRGEWKRHLCYILYICPHKLQSVRVASMGGSLQAPRIYRINNHYTLPYTHTHFVWLARTLNCSNPRLESSSFFFPFASSLALHLLRQTVANIPR